MKYYLKILIPAVIHTPGEFEKIHVESQKIVLSKSYIFLWNEVKEVCIVVRNQF